jgi:hypothetical protein
VGSLVKEKLIFKLPILAIPAILAINKTATTTRLRGV